MRLKILPSAISIICFVIFTIPSAAVYGQSAKSEKALILYDPLLWKGELKLDAYQCKKIKEINSAYYQRLLSTVSGERNSSVIQRKAVETLLHRSEEIWQTFHPKQRKRLRKLWNETSSWWTINKRDYSIEHL